MMKTMPLAIAVAIALSIAQPANAADYLFKVPVDVRNLPPQITNLNVACNLRKDANSPYLGVGLRQIDGISGSYTAIVDVEVNLNAGVTDAPALWFCTLTLGGIIAGTFRSWKAPNVGPADKLQFDGAIRPPNLPEFLPAQSGTTPVTRNNGVF